MKTYQVDENGYYGEFGGAYVPEILHQCVENLQKKYLEVLESDSFKNEFNQLLRDYVGRPSPLYQAKRLSVRPYSLSGRWSANNHKATTRKDFRLMRGFFS